MPILEPVIRPPAEAESFLLQVTLGCSADHCSFCGAYKTKPFRIKDPTEIFSDIERYARRYPGTRRVFLMDGDALVLGPSKLIPILEKLEQSFPRLARVSSYANGANFKRISDAGLAELYQRKLSLIYMGLESGSQAVLDRCGKTSSVGEMIEAVQRAEQSGIRSSVIVLLGLGGKRDSAGHVSGTIEALNRMQPRYLSFLSLMVIPGTPLADEIRRGEFVELNSRELLREAYEIVQGLELRHTVFRSDHASNHLPLQGTFPKDKPALLTALKAAFDGGIRLRPEGMRGL
ncbi:MAG TPA: radical SAM protein [Candidatus Omnitrophota bacterium]|nr:radical SAM protein [Candidatus Omnitrophota bacterium]